MLFCQTIQYIIVTRLIKFITLSPQPPWYKIQNQRIDLSVSVENNQMSNPRQNVLRNNYNQKQNIFFSLGLINFTLSGVNSSLATSTPKEALTETHIKLSLCILKIALRLWEFLLSFKDKSTFFAYIVL